MPRKPKQPKAEKPTRLEKCLARIIKNGGIVMEHHGPNGGRLFHTANGKEVSPDVLQQLVRAGMMRSGEDGLPGFNSPQTYHVCQKSVTGSAPAKP